MRSRLVVSALVTILAAPILPGCNLTDPARVDSIHRMNEGIRQLQKGNLSGAEKALQEAIKLDPTHDIAYLNLGKLYRKEEKWVDAQKAYEGAIQNMGANPNAEFHYELGVVLVAQANAQGVSRAEQETKFREAITAFQDAIKLKPNHYKAQYQMGFLHEKLDEPEQADSAYRAAIKSNGYYSLAYVALGNMYIDYGFSNVAMAVLETGTQINDTDAAMWNGMGRALLNLNKAKDAVDSFSKARAIDPDMPDVLFGLGMAYAELRQKNEAITALEDFLKKATAQTPEHTQKAARDTLARMQDVI